MKNKILITGGSGFIGTHLGKELISLGHDVTVIDIRKPKYDVKHIELDISEDKFMYFSHTYDYIFHMAAAISVPESIENPYKYFKNNTQGTYNVLKFAENNKVKRVIFSSSASVYGNNSPPHLENMKSDTLNMYAASKAAGEDLMRVWSNLYGVDTISLRYFNIFGPGQDPKSPYAAVIPKFINKILKDEIITISGDGNQTRDFIYIKDVIYANILAMESKNNFNGEVVNIASGKSISINDLINSLLLITKKNFTYEYASRRIGEVLNSSTNNNKAERLLGFSPKYIFNDALLETFIYFSKNNRF